MTFDVYGVGNSLVDIQAQVSDEIVARLGFHKGVMTLVDETAQRRVLGALEGVPLSRCAGGSCPPGRADASPSAPWAAGSAPWPTDAASW